MLLVIMDKFHPGLAQIKLWWGSVVELSIANGATRGDAFKGYSHRHIIRPRPFLCILILLKARIISLYIWESGHEWRVSYLGLHFASSIPRRILLNVYSGFEHNLGRSTVDNTGRCTLNYSSVIPLDLLRLR